MEESFVMDYVEEAFLRMMRRDHEWAQLELRLGLAQVRFVAQEYPEICTFISMN